MFDLKAFRKERKLSQKQISEVLGIGTSFISQIETGKDPMPSYIPEKLAAAFGKEEVDRYFKESPFSVDAGRFLRKRYMFPGPMAYSQSRKTAAGMEDLSETMDAMFSGKKMDAGWIDRLLRAIERRDELAMMQQKEYERQGERIDELLAFLKDQTV